MRDYKTLRDSLRTVQVRLSNGSIGIVLVEDGKVPEEGSAVLPPAKHGQNLRVSDLAALAKLVAARKRKRKEEKEKGREKDQKGNRTSRGRTNSKRWWIR